MLLQYFQDVTDLEVNLRIFPICIKMKLVQIYSEALPGIPIQDSYFSSLVERYHKADSLQCVNGLP